MDFEIKQDSQELSDSHVNNFEYDYNREHFKRVDSMSFSDKSNTHFIYDDINELVNTTKGLEKLHLFLNDFNESQVDRLRVLEQYSNGDNTLITTGSRRIEPEKADYRIKHNFGGYISKFVTGYAISKPVTIEYKGGEDSNTSDLETVAGINEYNDIDTLNYNLGYDTSRYGRAFELHYRDKYNRDCIALIETTDLFVIRDTTIEQEIIAAVHCPRYESKQYVTVYTDSEIIEYTPISDKSTQLRETNRQAHFYDMVPVVEWWNNRHRTGDFEHVLSLIDAYDSVESDSANYMSDFNDSTLVISGDFDGTGLDIKQLQQMKRDMNILFLQSGVTLSGQQTQINAEYIYKQYDVNGAEAYKNRLVNDIFTLTNVPNLSDEKFTSADSGIALQYKLIGLQQIRAIKESFYTKALKRRYELIENIHKALNVDLFDSSALTFTFHQNLPQDIWNEVTQYVSVGGAISQETLRGIASFTTNQLEKERLENEDNRPDHLDFEKGYSGDLDE